MRTDEVMLRLDVPEAVDMPCDCFHLCLGAHRDGDGGRVRPLLKKPSAPS